MREKQSYFLQNCLKSLYVVFIAKKRLFREGPGGILGYLCKAGMLFSYFLVPKLLVRQLNIGSNVDIEFVLPKHPVLLTTTLLLEETAFVTSLASAEDVPTAPLGIS